jgi:hypothetical protein
MSPCERVRHADVDGCCKPAPVICVSTSMSMPLFSTAAAPRPSSLPEHQHSITLSPLVSNRGSMAIREL